MKKMKKKCHDFVDNHSDLIIDLIIKGFAPKEICRELQLCSVAEEIDDSTEDRKLFFIKSNVFFSKFIDFQLKHKMMP